MENLELIEKLVEYKKIIFTTFAFENAYAAYAAAFIFVAKNEKPDPVKLKECNEYLKANTGAFSQFRGVNKLVVIAKMYFSNDSKKLIDKIDAIQKALKTKFKWTSEIYLFLSALVLQENINEEDVYKFVEKARKIYDLIKKAHPFLTSAADVPYAAMLSLMKKDENVLLEDIENIYNIMRKESLGKSAVLKLAMVLSMLDGLSNVEKCEKIVSLLDALKSAGCKYGKYLELPTIAPFIYYTENYNMLAYQFAELEEKLKSYKGFGGFSLTKAQRLMFIAQLMFLNSENLNNFDNYLVLNSLTEIFMQQMQIVMISVCTATSVAIASANS